MPYSLIFFTAFMTVFSPAQHLVEATFATDYGYLVLHRIAGEYVENHRYGIASSETVYIVCTAAMDCLFANLILFSGIFGFRDFLVSSGNGKVLSHEF